MRMRVAPFLAFLLLACFNPVQAEGGYDLWLRYAPVTDTEDLESLTKILGEVLVPGADPTLERIRDELIRAGAGMLGSVPAFRQSELLDGGSQAGIGLVIGTPETCSFVDSEVIRKELEGLGKEGYYMAYEKGESMGPLIIAANSQFGLLYGTFHLLRDLQAYGAPQRLPLHESPDFNHRLLNHWDNLDRTVERGYAGFSIWDWHRLPGYIDQRYRDYARANASIGINGSVVTSVNANALILTPAYIEKVAALADVFRPYGIRIYLTARFSAPVELDSLERADPLDPAVQNWWKKKASEIYGAIPDFGGFLVKANSEGQPGPQNYGRSHVDGANMLADALAPHGGIVMWRAFVYSYNRKIDRAMQANLEFEPFDGQFRENVVIQVKNGAIDFQPREPFHPLFGAMPETDLALELQITQEYLGQATQLAYLAPMYKECLDADTYRPHAGSTVARIVDGSMAGSDLSVLAGVSNIGTDRNWTGHPFGQANWYAFGRLGWDHSLSSEEIAVEWIRMTYGQDPQMLETILEIMMASREAIVDYMTPLGLHHIMGRNHHYGPGPWIDQGRPDWTSVYYHKADTMGIGFDRTAGGSNALLQYADKIRAEWSDPATIPEKYLLWFHHLPWDHLMATGNILWDELCLHYDRGVGAARRMEADWTELEGRIDRERFLAVQSLLGIQVQEAEWWRNACLLYFQQYSRKPFPASIEMPVGELEEYMELQFPYAPGIKPTW